MGKLTFIFDISLHDFPEGEKFLPDISTGVQKNLNARINFPKVCRTLSSQDGVVDVVKSEIKSIKLQVKMPLASV